MTRAFDLASELEETQRQSAIAAHRHRPVDEGGDGLCVDCGEPIDPRRLAAVPMALRCAEHQADHERRQRLTFGARA